MSNSVSGNTGGVAASGTYKRAWASGFRQLQLALVWWGVLLIVGGYLHANYSTPWGKPLMLLMWLIITVLGFAGNYILAPAVINSGIAFVWGIVILLGFLITLIVLYPLNSLPYPALSVTWHLAFALGYLLNGYFSDRRLWWLAAWEMLMSLLMLYSAYNPPLDPTNPLSAGANPVAIGSFVFYNNQGILLGLMSGIPLIIAALPFWKENYSRG